MIGELERVAQEAEAEIAGAGDAAALEAARVAWLGRKGGRLSLLLRALGTLDASERPRVGAKANDVKAAIEAALDARAQSLGGGSAPDGPVADPTRPAREGWTGAIHPIQQVIDEIWEIFRGLGFTRARGPEVEDEWHNFVALNTSLEHPAADAADTFYLERPLLLRTHTSPVQVRTLRDHPPPVRILAPGMAYRRDTTDATHLPAFAQVEGLVIDEGVSFVDFKATLAEFARRFWGPGARVRFRPSFFPFTEPSAEVDVKYTRILPDGTAVESDWLEIMGAGMVDPAVLEHVGIDPERYTGWAFGMGPARVAMTRWGISDLRTFVENDVRFLGQFA
ncbi:MAG: phenylalanine--tRNA ligase subunit alpha [Gemmatimonadota bacterium]